MDVSIFVDIAVHAICLIKHTNIKEFIYIPFETGKKIYIPESNMIQWTVNATLEQLRVVIASENRGSIVDVSIHGMRADIKMSYFTTEIGMSITDMRIQDPNPEAIYKKVV